MQVAEAIAPVRPRARRRACCRSTAGSRSARSCARCERGVDVVVATPGRALDHLAPRHAAARRRRRSSCSTRPTRCSTWASPRTSRRSSPRRPATRQTVLFSATMPPRIDAHRRAATCSDPVRIDDRPRGRARRARRRASARRAYVVAARAQAGRARPRARRRGARPRRSSSAARATRSTSSTETLNGRGYRAEALHGGMTPGAARPRDEAAPRRRPPTCSSPPTSPRAASTSSSSRTSSTTTCPSAPERTCTASAASAAPAARASRSRSPSRASTACSRRSSARPGSRSRSRSCRPSPTCAPAGSS